MERHGQKEHGSLFEFFQEDTTNVPMQNNNSTKVFGKQFIDNERKQ